MLRFYVTDPDTDTETDYSALLRPEKKFEVGAKAFNGEADLGDLLLDDPTGVLDWTVDFAAHRRVRVTEDASGSELTLILGRIASKEYERGTFAADRGREFSISIEDANADLRGIVVHGWVRPAETGRARVLALLAAYLNGASSTALNPDSDPYGRDSTVIGDAYVVDAGNVSMPAETYNGSDPLRVLRACAEWEHKRAFVYVETNGSMNLYYAPTADTSALVCTIGVSDDPAVVDGVDVLEPHWIAGPALHTDADEMVSGALLIHSDGLTYDRRTAIEDVHDRWEEAVYSQQAASAGSAELDSLLDARELEQARRQFAVQVPADRVHLIRAGMLIDVEQARASTIDAPTSFRIVNARYAYRSPGVDGAFFTVILTLEVPIKLGATWPRPRPNPADSILIGVGGGSLATPTLYEVTLLVYLTDDGSVGINVAFDDPATSIAFGSQLFDYGHPGSSNLQWSVASGGVPYYASSPDIAEGWHTLRMRVVGTNQVVSLDGDEVTAVAADASDWGFSDTYAIQIGFGATAAHLGVDYIIGSAVIDDFNRVEASDWGVAWSILDGSPTSWSVDGSVGDAVSSYMVIQRDLLPTDFGPTGGLAIAYYGQDHTYIVTADGATDAWTFPFAYVPGTLEVKVDGQWQNSTEDDPTTGAFSISWMPASGDIVVARATVMP